ncbi:MAG: prohibitin family protein [Erysipelotrichaceae bacterium]|nr:prohibitin family protein [Erysipelotrichaceae bacterium]
MIKVQKKYILAVFGLILLVLLSQLCIVKVPTGHTGVVVTFGKVENYTLDSGVHAKLPWQSIIKMDNRIQKETVDLSAFSKDIQEVNMIYTVNYQISKNEAMTIYSTIGKEYYNTVISPSVMEAVKTVSAKYTAEELITDRTKLAVGIEAELSNALSRYNIELVSTSIEDIDFTDAFTDAVEAKQVAQQNKLKAETEAETKIIQANAEAEVKRIEADAEAYVNETTSESLTPEILQKMYYEKWNGVLPEIVSDSSMILSPMND